MSSGRPGVPGSKREIPKGRSGKESPGLGLLRAATEQAQVTRLLLKEISRALSLAPRAPFAKSACVGLPGSASLRRLCRRSARLQPPRHNAWRLGAGRMPALRPGPIFIAFPGAENPHEGLPVKQPVFTAGCRGYAQSAVESSWAKNGAVSRREPGSERARSSHPPRCLRHPI